MRIYAWAFALTTALSTVACVTGAGPTPERLYAPTTQALRADEVSTLSGYVQFVDGKDVSSLGTNFELLPGCHVIGTPSQWGAHSAGADSVVTATTGHWPFVLPMRAGYQYRIEVKVGAMTGPTGSLTIKGYESDLAGNETKEFERSTSPKDLTACQEAERSLPGGPSAPRADP
jgi:hypothetical protein